MGGDRVELRRTFDSAADCYEDARPGYPAEIFDALERLAALEPGDPLLEIGCATGIATRSLAERGYPITCVELGEKLAEQAARNLAPYPQVRVVRSAFEQYRDPSPHSYALVYAATSWHWLDPPQRYVRAHALLRPGGSLAFWSASHVFPDGGDPIFRELQPVYDEIGEGMEPGAHFSRPGELPNFAEEISESGLFERAELLHFDWELCYDADAYLRLLDSFSGHIAMQPWQRERLYGEIRRRLGEREDGLLRRHWGAVLHVARARS